MNAHEVRFGALVGSEFRRCLSRRAVKVLVGVALVGIVATGLIGFVAAGPIGSVPGVDPHLGRLADLWRGPEGGVLLPPIVLLAVGAFIGAAVVVGGEWKFGTVTTLATWEVRRDRLLAARLLACAGLAAGIGAALLALFVAATLPTVFIRGTTAGVDGAWALSVGGAVGRGLVLVALAAVLGGAAASIGRGTAPALAAVFLNHAVVEPTWRALRPGHSGWFLGENLAIWLSGGPLDAAPFERGLTMAAITLTLYAAALAAASIALFARRDLAGPAS